MFVNLIRFCKSLQSILKSPRSHDLSIALAADNDLDGLFSAVLLDLGFYDLFEVEVEIFFRDEVRWEIPIDQDFDLLIMLDLAYDNSPNYRKASSRARNSFAIDHHITKETGFPERVFAYNPCREGQCYLPTVFLVNQVINRLGQSPTPLQEYVNLLGVLADAGINFFTSNNNEINYSYDPKLENLFHIGRKQYDFLFEQEEVGEFVYPRFKKTIEALNIEAEELGWKELYYRFINEATDQSKAQELVEQIEKKHENAFEDLLQYLPKEPTEITKSGIWLIKNTSHLSNSVIGRVIAELYNTPIIAYSCAKFCRVSARAPADSTMNFIPLFSTFGGGHPKACGAFLTPLRFEELLEKIRKF
ncbi:MAG: DHH family phosphoesterase [Candidatus Heimdallarchaeota archaeon]|nr:MAG: DHH family phosphoesterase [Candidatus Heimdallarchaeota archaeon]